MQLCKYEQENLQGPHLWTATITRVPEQCFAAVVQRPLRRTLLSFSASFVVPSLASGSRPVSQADRARLFGPRYSWMRTPVRWNRDS